MRVWRRMRRRVGSEGINFFFFFFFFCRDGGIVGDGWKVLGDIAKASGKRLGNWRRKDAMFSSWGKH